MSVRRVRVSAPVRICDVGGWSDTWFAGHGRVCNIAITPGVTVEISQHAADTCVSLAHQAPLSLEMVAIQHPLIYAALCEIPLPDNQRWQIAIDAAIPPGCATGTSAAMAVALLIALTRLHGRTLSAYDAAQMAHLLETTRLGLQSGIQDQLAAAFGGINDIQMTTYPYSTVTPCHVSPQTLAHLDAQLQLWYLGRPHQSSRVHQDVITRFETIPSAQQLLDPLRAAAAAAVTALSIGDLVAYGQALQANTRAQQALHPALVCHDAAQIIDFARDAGAWGWKVNGAGGDGGSVSILWQDGDAAQRALEFIPTRMAHVVCIPSHICMTGAQVVNCEEEAE